MNNTYCTKINPDIYSEIMHFSFNNNINEKILLNSGDIENNITFTKNGCYVFTNKLINLLSMTGNIIINQTEIKEKYGNLINANCMMYSNDKIFIFNSKLIKPTIEELNMFRDSVKQICTFERKLCIGIFLSKSPIPYKSILYDDNNFKNVKYHAINDNNHNNLLNKITKKLYYYKQWLYEDECCIMLTQ